MARGNGKRGCGCFIWIIIILLIGLAFILFTGRDNNNDYNYDNYTEDTTFSSEDTTDSDENDSYDNEQEDIPENRYVYVYSQLTSKQQEIYDALLAGVPEGETEFSFQNVTHEDFRLAYRAFGYDHPEFFWLSINFDTYSYGETLKAEVGVYNYWTYSMNRQKYVDDLNKKIASIVAGGRHYTSTYDKVKYVHDYLATNVKYDRDALDEIDSSFRSTSTEQTLSVYGALVNGKTVCGGYSESFYLLMNALGVECRYLQGYAGEYHAWNCLKIDGDYYYMDVTWDDYDTVIDSDDNVICDNGIVYSYFCITSDDLAKTHTPDSDFWSPDCNATDYNYFVRNGYYFTKYNFQAVRKAFNSQKGMDIVSVKFASEYEYKKAIADLINNYKIYDIELFKDKADTGYTYYHDDKMYIISICLE